jgi:hypothetical protein
LAKTGFLLFSDPVFKDLLKDSILSIRKSYWKAPLRLACGILEKALA